MNKYNYGVNDTGQEDTNWPVYRYGGVLLMLAESLVEAGRAGEAQPHLDAGPGARWARVPVPATRETVRAERRVELAFENHRWFDLVRWGIAEPVMQAQGPQQKAEKGVRPTGAISPSSVHEHPDAARHPGQPGDDLRVPPEPGLVAHVAA